jgi:hypothetical protein
MIDPNTLVQWQKIDESVDAVFPWFTHPFLDVLKKWDLSNKRVLEFGGGRSTAWWRKKAKWVSTVEANNTWANQILKECYDKNLIDGAIWVVPINEGDSQYKEEYTKCAERHAPFDIVIVDGILRYECLEYALTLPRPLTLIADNWDQDFVWISPAAIELMKPYDIHVFEQSDHTDNEGKKWKTVFWELT